MNRQAARQGVSSYLRISARQSSNVCLHVQAYPHMSSPHITVLKNLDCSGSGIANLGC